MEQGKCPAVKFFSSLIPMPAKEPLQASNNISQRNRNCGFKLDTLLTAIQAALDKQIVAAKWLRGMVCLLSSPLLVVAYILVIITAPGRKKYHGDVDFYEHTLSLDTFSLD